MAELASGSIDLNSLRVAGESATKYITTIDGGGIKVHDSENQNLNYIKLTSNGMEIFKTNGAATNPSAMSVASFGSTTRIGNENSDHVTIDANGLCLFDTNGNYAGQLVVQNGAYALNLQDTRKCIQGITSSSADQLTIACEGALANKHAVVWIKANGTDGVGSLYLCDDLGTVSGTTGTAYIHPDGVNISGVLRVSQDLMVNGHNTSIGYLERDSVEVDIDTPGVSNLVEGAFASLSPGSYYIVGECAFPGREGSPTYTNLEVQIYNQTNNVVLGRQRVVVYRNAETHLQAATAVATTATTTDIYVRVSSGSECLGCTTKIRVMRIA